MASRALLVCLVLATAARAETYAVLAAGLEGWENMGFQADVYHMWHILVEGLGVPGRNVIVLAYDDVARSPENPTPGLVPNEPGGPDVYAGVPIDYSIDEVTPEIWIDVVLGNPVKAGSQRVLASKGGDDVFLLLEDHGTTGQFTFPGGETLYRNDLINAIWSLHRAGRFRRMWVFVSACFSGSLFNGAALPPNVFVTTSAPISGYSSRILCDEKKMCYSAAVSHGLMLQLLDPKNSSSRSLLDAFGFIAEHMENSSFPCTYGDASMANSTTLGQFFEFSASRTVPPELGFVATSAMTEVDLADVPLLVASGGRSPVGLQQAQMNVRMAVDRAMESLLDVVPLARHPACGSCTDECFCLHECLGESSMDRCRYVCCTTKGCDIPWSGEPKEQECVDVLVRRWQQLCGSSSHPYVAKAEALLHRLCRVDSDSLQKLLLVVEEKCRDVSSIVTVAQGLNKQH